jgi:hypothetical protein
MRNRMFAAAVLVAAAGGLAACGDDRDMAATPGAPATTTVAMPAVIVPESALPDGNATTAGAPGRTGEAAGVETGTMQSGVAAEGAPSAAAAGADASATTSGTGGDPMAIRYAGERG